MPRRADEEQWQYMDRMVSLAHGILAYAREPDSPEVFYFRDVAFELSVDEEDVAVACNTFTFAQEAVTHDRFFFLKTPPSAR